MSARAAFAEGDEVEAAEFTEQVAYELELLRPEHDVTSVASSVDVVERRPAEAALFTRYGRSFEGKRRAGDIGCPGDRRVEHGDVDIVASSGFLST